MVLTLATDYSGLRGVLAFPAAVLMYLGAAWIALLVSRVRRGGVWGLVVLWGLLFPVAQVVASGLGGSKDQVWLMTIGPTAVTVPLLWWATRSWIAPLGCVVGWLAAGAAGPSLVRNDEQWLLAVPWNVCVGSSLLLWAAWVRGRAEQTGVCERCRYDPKGLPGGVCPECGMQVGKGGG